MKMQETKGKDDIINSEFLTGGKLNEEDLIRIHILWVGNAMSRLFELGYRENNIMTFCAAVDALESLLETRTKENEYKKFIDEEYKKQLPSMYDLHKNCPNMIKGFKIYELIRKKYRHLIRLAYKEYVETPVVDNA